MTFRSRPLLDLCKGRPCISCDIQDETVIAAHRNHGKGMGIKTSDAMTIPLCATCHREFDAYEWFDADERFLLLYAEHMDNLFTEGKIQVTNTRPRSQKYRPPAKVLPRRMA